MRLRCPATFTAGERNRKGMTVCSRLMETWSRYPGVIRCEDSITLSSNAGAETGRPVSRGANRCANPLEDDTRRPRPELLFAIRVLSAEPAEVVGTRDIEIREISAEGGVASRDGAVAGRIVRVAEDSLSHGAGIGVSKADAGVMSDAGRRPRIADP